MKDAFSVVVAPKVTRRFIAALGTLLLLAFCTWGQLCLRHLTGAHRPYTIFYLIPVAIGAALMGVRGGIAAALVAVLLARFYLFDDPEQGAALLSFPIRASVIEFLALLAGTLTIAAITGRLRSTLGLLRAAGEKLNQTNHHLEEANRRLEHSNARLVEMEEQRRIFHRDVLMAVTGGKLRLIEPEDMPPSDLVTGRPRLTLSLQEPSDASHLRTRLQMLGRGLDLDHERVFDLCTGATEAATNAIKHGRGGEAQVWADADSVAVLIKDRGDGIAPAHLARATLEQGYSTRVSLGMGFHLMLETSDMLVLSTSPQGTSILLRVLVGTPVSEEDAFLARYVGL